MKKEINFIYPFSGYWSLNYINCFTSTYMYIEGYDGMQDCYCGDKLDVCNSCGDCKATIGKKQEELFFLFGTMTGFNALRNSFDRINEMQESLDDTDELINFTMQFVGYEYEKLTKNFKKAIIESIDVDKPVLARMKNKERGSFRVINGYDNDGDTLICPEPIGAQSKPNGAPRYDEIKNIYLITGEKPPTIGMKEGFEQIVRVMEFNSTNDLWGDYLNRFNYWDDLIAADIQEIENRFKRVSDTMWYTFNSHNFAETFVRELYHRTNDQRLRECFHKIREEYWSTHNQCWQVIALHDCRDWSNKRYNEIESGMCNYVIMSLEIIKKNDETVLRLLKECIEILEV